MIVNSFGLYRPGRPLLDRAEVTGEFIDTVVTQWLAVLGSRYDHCE
jgi:hypothetical protein